ncbi:hypothetical protein C8Q80DRAFT_1150166 [Daedaleopsis nitida]|nr:hypothetical protein C8Q80DRAFT_1150166 [Daedaleopsis nitida]
MLAPSSSYARSSRYRQHVGSMHAPITETPFDCFGPECIVPTQLQADELNDMVLMACFGRPLWRSLLWPHPDNLLKTFDRDGTAATLAHIKSTPTLDSQCRGVLDVACAKLLYEKDLSRDYAGYSNAARSAVLDVRLTLSYEPSCAQQHELNLVASHMRTVYSVRKGRESVRSGYPSEPILAVAAARLLTDWDRAAKKTGGHSPYIKILHDHLKDDLLASGEIGEAVGRLLLLIARDRAEPLKPDDETKADARYSRYARPVSVISFIKALSPKNIAERILQSVPDNLPPPAIGVPVTFAKAFENAVINFTHFAKWADMSAINQRTALACYIRGMAPICRNNGPLADAFLPICIDPTKPLTPENMTGIIVQSKLRAAAGSLTAYAISQEKLGLFPKVDPSASELRAYITLIMELGVTDSLPLLARTPTDYNSKTAKQERKRIKEQREDETSNQAAVNTPSKLVLPQPSKRGRPRRDHPRYSIYVYGCSPTVYAVIDPSERTLYRATIRGDHLLGDHPRQDERSLSMVRHQKPFFAVGHASWNWLHHSLGLSPDKQDWEAVWQEKVAPKPKGTDEKLGESARVVLEIGTRDDEERVQVQVQVQDKDEEADEQMNVNAEVTRDDEDVFMSETTPASSERRAGHGK